MDSIPREIFEWDERGTPIRITGTQKDITERKNLERELAIKEARLNAFFSCAPVGLAIFDEQLRYVRVNEQLAEINGYSIEEHIGKTVEEILPRMASEIILTFEQVLATGQPVLNQELSGFSFQEPGSLRYVLASFSPSPTKMVLPVLWVRC
ncbi:MAG: PAS domain S-box protein [Calothrix sp. SM1_7_51]|nr:PAS domain S-box protein [Calothrix sp. SM1_7_51]